MNFAPLENILRRPEKPLEIGQINGWHTFEYQLNTKLPEDYKKFIQSFGTGSINEFLVILNPFSANQHVNLLTRGRSELEAFRTSKTNFPKYYPDDIFPNSGGLLPFGVTDNGEVLYWRTIAEPKDWTVTVYETRGPDHYNYQTNMTDFLSGVLSGAIICKALPRNFVNPIPAFNPIGPFTRTDGNQ